MDLKFFSPSTLAEALDYLHQNDDVKIIAGGTDLLVKNYDKLDLLGNLMDISKLSELKQIEAGEHVRIGALITHYELESHPWFISRLPMLSYACGEVGAAQIRHRGTIGGNIGNASPAADSVAPLIVLDAQIELASVAGSRKMPLEEFFTGPGQTKRAANELITGVSFAAPGENQGSSFVKLGKRKAMAIATASVAVSVSLSNDKSTLADLRMCLGSVAPVPLRARATEAVLRGKSLRSLPLKDALASLEREITPIDDIRGTAQYRLDSSGAIMVRALAAAIREAGGEFND